MHLPNDLLKKDEGAFSSSNVDPLRLRFTQKSGPLRQITFLTERFKDVEKDGRSLVVSGGRSETLLSGIPPRVPFFCCEVHLAGMTGGKIGTGIIKGENHFAVAVYDRASHAIHVAINRNGKLTLGPVVALSRKELPRIVRLVVTGAYLSAYAEYADGSWDETASFNARLSLGISFSEKAYYDGSYQYGAICSADEDATFSIDRIKAGIFGGLGVRDIYIVNDHAGNPVIKDNKVYFSGTTINLCSDGDIPSLFHSVGGGIWTCDLATYAIEQISFFFFDEGDAIYGIPAFSLNYAPGNSILLAYCSWRATGSHGEGTGTGFIHIEGDPFSGVHFFTDILNKPMPEGMMYNCDGQMFKRGDTWHVGLTYKLSSFSNNASFELTTTTNFKNFETVHLEPMTGTPVAPELYEAAKVSRIGNKIYFLFAGASDVRIHDGFNGQLLGSIPQSIAYHNNPANHSGIFPFEDGYGWLTFDGENYKSERYTYGNFYFFQGL